MINRIRDIRKQKGMTLADLAEACDPPTTPQTVGRLETGMRNLSLKWMERIAAALDVEADMLVRSERARHPQIVAKLAKDGPEALSRTRDAILSTDLGGDGALMVLDVDYPHGDIARATSSGCASWTRKMPAAPSTAMCWCRKRGDASPSGG